MDQNGILIMIKLVKEINEKTLELFNGVFAELFTYQNHSVPKHKPGRIFHPLLTHTHTQTEDV